MFREMTTTTIPTVGQRYRLTREVDRFPSFIAPAGSTGTIIAVDQHLIALRLDAPLAGAEDWDNAVHWYDDDCYTGNFSDDCEIIE
jgi:hypothetical protein